MKYFIIVFITAIVVFLGATVYYKGLPNFTTPQGISVTSTESATISTSEQTPAPEVDEGMVSEAIKTALIKKYGPNASDMEVTVSKIDGEYAKGMVTEEGGGGMWFAARLNGTWTLVWDGNGIITCDDISPYPEFPANMIPECWDNSTSKLITR